MLRSLQVHVLSATAGELRAKLGAAASRIKVLEEQLQRERKKSDELVAKNMSLERAMDIVRAVPGAYSLLSLFLLASTSCQSPCRMATPLLPHRRLFSLIVGLTAMIYIAHKSACVRACRKTVPQCGSAKPLISCLFPLADHLVVDSTRAEAANRELTSQLAAVKERHVAAVRFLTEALGEERDDHLKTWALLTWRRNVFSRPASAPVPPPPPAPVPAPAPEPRHVAEAATETYLMTTEASRARYVPSPSVASLRADVEELETRLREVRTECRSLRERVGAAEAERDVAESRCAVIARRMGTGLKDTQRACAVWQSLFCWMRLCARARQRVRASTLDHGSLFHACRFFCRDRRSFVSHCRSWERYVAASSAENLGAGGQRGRAGRGREKGEG